MPATDDPVRTAKDAEAAGLDGIWTGDHLVTTAPVLDGTATLAAAAGATTRLGLGWAVLLPALRPLAWAWRSVASVQAISGGRLQLGVGVGGRIGGPDAPDEWRAAEQPARGRAARLDSFLARLPDALGGRPVAMGDTEATLLPAVAAPPLWVGGTSDRAFGRVLEHGAGWLASQLTPSELEARAAQLGESAAARGVAAPRIGTVVFAAPGSSAALVSDHLTAVYGMDRERAESLAVGGGREQLRDGLAALSAAGADTLVVVPLGPGDAVDRLAEARP